MLRIIPIRDLKNTSAISQSCHALNEPIVVTKNGYGDMVIMSIDCYDSIANSYGKNGVHSFNDILRITGPIFKKYNVNYAVLFGSYAKGLARADSDVDIMVDSGLKGLKFYGLLDEISDALNKDVDLIDVREIESGSQLEHEIKRTGVRIYGI